MNNQIIKTGYAKLNEISSSVTDQNLLQSFMRARRIIKNLNQRVKDRTFHRLINMEHYMDNSHILVSYNPKRVEDHLWNMIMHSSEDDPLTLGDYVLSLRAIINNPAICKTTGLTLIEDGSAHYVSANQFRDYVLVPVIKALSENNWD